MKRQTHFAVIELAALLAIGLSPLFGLNALAEESFKTIVGEDGRKVITNDWPPKRNYSAPVANRTSSQGGNYQQPQQAASQTPQELMETGGIGGAVEARRSIDSQEHARELMQTGGIGGAVEARMYTDMENSDDSEYQQQRELRKMKKELQRMKTQKIIDSYTAH
jgi:hypothetical protein